MILSKSFGYALRGTLYVAVMKECERKVQLGEIAERLAVPRHFLGKVMKRLVKEGVLTSVKGPYGGFCINDNTLQTKLLRLTEISGDSALFDSCVLRFRKCDELHPCPMHCEVDVLRKKWIELLTNTTLGDLLRNDQPDLIKSIAAI